MAYITGRFNHPKIEDLAIEVMQPTKSENDFKRGLHISFETPFAGGDFTPESLLEVAKWVTDTVNTIQKDYNKDGSRKDGKNNYEI